MKNRDMFYQNFQESYNPGMYIPPNYNMNQFQSYQGIIPTANNINNNDYEDRISKLERQVRNLDGRLQKLENVNTDTTDNFYMI